MRSFIHEFLFDPSMNELQHMLCMMGQSISSKGQSSNQRVWSSLTFADVCANITQSWKGVYFSWAVRLRIIIAKSFLVSHIQPNPSEGSKSLKAFICYYRRKVVILLFYHLTGRKQKLLPILVNASPRK